MQIKVASFRALSKAFYKTVAFFDCMAFHRIAVRFDPAAVAPLPNHPLGYWTIRLLTCRLPDLQTRLNCFLLLPNP
jgi:hypothetical protein